MLLVGVERDHFHRLKTMQEKHKPNQQILQRGPGPQGGRGWPSAPSVCLARRCRVLGLAQGSSPGQAQRGETRFPSLSLPERGVSTQKKDAGRMKLFIALLWRGSGMEPLGGKGFYSF